MLFWRKTFISNQFVWSDLARIRKFSQQRTDILGFLEDNLLVMLEVKLKVLSTGICSLSSTSVFLHLPLIWITLHVHLMDIVQSIFWSGVSCWTLLNKPHRAFFFTFMRGRKTHYLFWVHLVKSIAAFFPSTFCLNSDCCFVRNIPAW